MMKVFTLFEFREWLSAVCIVRLSHPRGDEKRDVLSNSLLGMGKLIDLLSLMPFFD